MSIANMSAAIMKPSKLMRDVASAIEAEQKRLKIEGGTNLWARIALDILEGNLFARKRPSVSAAELLRRAKQIQKKNSKKEKRVYRKLKSLLRSLHRTFTYTTNRDIRLAYRSIVHTLFKTMDDTSGSDNKIVFQASTHDFNNYKMFQPCLIKHNLYKLSTN